MHARVETMIRDMTKSDTDQGHTEGGERDGTLAFNNFGLADCYPGVVCPLTFSFVQAACVRTGDTFLRLAVGDKRTLTGARAHLVNFLHLIDGRLYCDRGALNAALACLPGGRRFHSVAQYVLGLNAPLDLSVGTRPRTQNHRGIFTAITEPGRETRLVFRIARHAFKLRRTVIAFRQRADSVLSLDDRTLGALSLADLAHEYRRIETEVLHRWDAPVANELAFTIAYLLTRKLFRQWFGARGVQILVNDLIGFGNLTTAEPAQRLRAMAGLVAGDLAMLDALRTANIDALRHTPILHQLVQRYLAKFRDSGIAALKFESVPIGRDPAPLLVAVLAAALQTAVKPGTAADPPPLLNQLCKRRPLLLRLARTLLHYTRSRLRDREQLRFEQIQIHGLLRRIFLAMGKAFAQQHWIVNESDVLYLTVTETLGLAEGTLATGSLRQVVSQRRRDTATAAGRADPPNCIFGTRQADPHPKPLENPAIQARTILNGRGYWQRVVQGKAHVVVGMPDPIPAPGCILVARSINPGWIAYYATAAALVVEDSGLLPQAAILAHALGIPCISAIRHATAWLATGDILEVNGATGTVTKLGNAP